MNLTPTPLQNPKSLATLQKQAQTSGANQLSSKEIEREIRIVRQKSNLIRDGEGETFQKNKKLAGSP